MYHRILHAWIVIWLCALTRGQSTELHAQLLNTAGAAVTNAAVTVHAVVRANGTRYDHNEDVDARAVSDQGGFFTIHGTNAFLGATLTAEAAGYAKTIFTEIPSGPQTNALKMLNGATVTGSLVKEGKAVLGAEIALRDSDPASKIFSLFLQTKTDSNGHFELQNVPSKRQLFLFGSMASLAAQGVLPTRKLVTPTEGGTLDVGELQVEAGFTVAGKLPKESTITLSRADARESITNRTDVSGAFIFTNVPGEIIAMSAELAGRRLSDRNASLDPANPTQLIGKVATNILDLAFDYDAGPPLEPSNVSAVAARQEPLRAAEPPHEGPQMLEVRGTIETADVGPFTTTEARAKMDGSFDWLPTRKHRHSNSSFVTHLPRGQTPSALVVQADGFAPWLSGPITTATNLVIRLERANSLSGAVLKPNGAPATNVSVYLADSFTTTTFENFTPLFNNSVVAVTDREGKFSFPPMRDAQSMIIFDPAGFAQISAQQLKTNHVIQLQTLGRVQGNLRIGNAAGTNQLIRLTTAPIPYQWFPRELPAYTIGLTARTDAAGNFFFENVPPTIVEVAHSPNLLSTAGGPAASPLGGFPISQSQRIAVTEGQTNEVILGGKGRRVVGRIAAPHEDDAIDWRGSFQSMENLLPGEPDTKSEAATLFEKLRETARRDMTAAQRKAAEEAYQTERKKIADYARTYFQTEKGRAAFFASHHYFLEFATDGSFHIEDVPPGKYALTMRLLNSDPAAMNTRRWILGELQTVVEVPEGTGPLDLGVLKATALPKR